MEENSKKPMVVNKSIIKVILIIFMAISVFITVVGTIVAFANRNKANRCTEKVTAVCTEYKIKTMKTRGRETGRRSYVPVFKYKYNGQTYEVRYSKSFSEKYKDTFEVDKEYNIRINPRYPRQFVVEGHEADETQSAFIAPVGGFLSILFYACIYAGICKGGKKDVERI